MCVRVCIRYIDIFVFILNSTAVQPKNYDYYYYCAGFELKTHRQRATIGEFNMFKCDGYKQLYILKAYLEDIIYIRRIQSKKSVRFSRTLSAECFEVNCNSSEYKKK